MTTRRGCFVLVSGLFAVFVLGGGVFFILNNAAQNRLERLQALNAPPDVYVTSPETGMVVSPGSFELVQVVAVGPNPIQRIELWWDGVKLDESINENEIADSFTASFPVQVAGGPHMLVARVVDAKGIIGQSFPMGVYGDPQLTEAASESFVFAQEGQSLEDIATTYSVPVDVLAQSNPTVPSGSVRAGTQIIFPNAVGAEPAPTSPPAPNSANTAVAIPALTMLQVDPNALARSNLTLFAAGQDQNRPVQAPAIIEFGERDCQFTVIWQDNSDNELVNSIWMSDFIRPGRRIAILQPSPSTGMAWFQFEIPAPGNYGLWVEAANWLGAQKSEVVWFRVPNHNCPSQTARDLEFELITLDITGGYDRAYCYVSVEGRSEARIPPWKDSFYFALPAGQSNAPTKNLFSIPPDDVLNLEGECWKWQGGTLIKIGDLKEAIPKSDWDGSQKIMAVGSSAFFYSIKPLGNLNVAGQYVYEDTSITPPHSLRLEAAVQSIPPQAAAFEPQRVLTWEWNGNEQITGFNIYYGWDSGIIKHVGPNDRKILVTLPERCSNNQGDTSGFSVAATFGKSESQRADVELKLAPCPLEATVEFVELTLTSVDDDIDPPFNPPASLIGCGSYLNAYFTLSASFGGYIEKREYYDDDDPLIPALACGTYDFPILVVGSPLHRYPPPPNKVIFTGLLDGGTTNIANVGVGISMYDEDDFGDDLIVSFFTHFVDSLENWKTYDETVRIFFNSFPDASGYVTIRVTGQQMQP